MPLQFTVPLVTVRVPEFKVMFPAVSVPPVTVMVALRLMSLPASLTVP